MKVLELELLVDNPSKPNHILLWPRDIDALRKNDVITWREKGRKVYEKVSTRSVIDIMKKGLPLQEGPNGGLYYAIPISGDMHVDF